MADWLAPDTATIRRAGGFASHGEKVHRHRNRAGKVAALLYAGARLVDETAIRRELTARYGDKKKEQS